MSVWDLLWSLYHTARLRMPHLYLLGLIHSHYVVRCGYETSLDWCTVLVTTVALQYSSTINTTAVLQSCCLERGADLPKFVFLNRYIFSRITAHPRFWWSKIGQQPPVSLPSLQKVYSYDTYVYLLYVLYTSTYCSSTEPLQRGVSSVKA